MHLLKLIYFIVTTSMLLMVVSCSSSSDPKDSASNPDLVNPVETQSGDLNGAAIDAEMLINTDNFERLTKIVVDAINLTALEQDKNEAQALLDELYIAGESVQNGGNALTGLTFLSQEEGAGSTSFPETVQNYSCDEGGSLSLVIYDLSGAPPFDIRNTVFNHCSLNGHTYNGALESSSYGRVDKPRTYRGYSRVSPDRTVELDGQFVRGYPPFNITESLRWEESTYVVSNSDNNYKLDGINWRRSGLKAAVPADIEGFVQLPDGIISHVSQINYSGDLEASFNLTSSATKSEPLSVSVDLSYLSQYFRFTNNIEIDSDLPIFPVSDLGESLDISSTVDFTSGTIQTVKNTPEDPAPQWQKGEVRITAIDGSSIVLTPDTADTNSVLIKVNDSDEPVHRLWRDGYQIHCSVVNLGCQ